MPTSFRRASPDATGRPRRQPRAVASWLHGRLGRPALEIALAVVVGVAAFDGVLAISSPPGGPTSVTMEIPCELSSPKTSSC